MAATAAAKAKKVCEVFDTPYIITLVQQAKAGDEAAFSTLYHKFYRYLSNTIMRVLPGHQLDIADWLANKAMTQAWLNLKDFNENSKFQTWITRIAINEWKMYIREETSIGRQRDKELSLNEILDENPSLSDGTGHNTGHNSTGKFGQRDINLAGIADRQMLDLSLSGIPSVYRDIVYLRLWMGFSVKEIGNILGISSLNQVRMNIVKGRKMLLEQVKKNSTSSPRQTRMVGV